MAAKRKTMKAPVPVQATGPLPSDLRYSDLDQPSMLRPMGIGAAVGAGLVGTLGGFFMHKKIGLPLVEESAKHVAYVRKRLANTHAAEEWDAAHRLVRDAPWTHAKHELVDAHLNTRPANYYDAYSSTRNGEDILGHAVRSHEKDKKGVKALTAGASLGGGVIGGIIGAVPGFAYGMKKEREYEDAIKVKGMEAYEKAAEVISGDPDENIIDTTSKNKRSRVAAGAAIGALALGVPTGLLAHRTAKKGINVLNGARALAETQGLDLAGAAAALRDSRVGQKENFFKRKGLNALHRVMAGPFKKVPLKLNALPAAAAGVVGAGAGAIGGHEYDYGESRSVGRTKDEVDVRGHRLRRVGAGLATGAAIGVGRQLLHARKNPMRIKIPIKEIGEMVDTLPSREIKDVWAGVRSLGIPAEIAHPFALETRAVRALGATGLGGAAGLGYDMGVRSGYDDQETEFDTDSGTRASPATLFNVGGAAVPAVASSMVPIPGFLKPKPKTLAIAGGIGGLMNIVGRFRGRKISETARAVEKTSSVREYGQLFSSITSGELGSQAQAALEGIHEVAASSFQKKAETDIFTDGMDEKSRRRRLAELLKRREATGTASGSASPNPPQDS